MLIDLFTESICLYLKTFRPSIFTSRGWRRSRSNLQPNASSAGTSLCLWSITRSSAKWTCSVWSRFMDNSPSTRHNVCTFYYYVYYSSPHVGDMISGVVSMWGRCWVYMPLEKMRFLSESLSLRFRAVGRKPKDAGSIPVSRRFSEFFLVTYQLLFFYNVQRKSHP